MTESPMLAGAPLAHVRMRTLDCQSSLCSSRLLCLDTTQHGRTRRRGGRTDHKTDNQLMRAERRRAPEPQQLDRELGWAAVLGTLNAGTWKALFSNIDNKGVNMNRYDIFFFKIG